MTSEKPSDSTSHKGIPELLTVHELAAILKLSHRSIWRLVRSGQLPAPIHLGASTRWRADLIATWLKRSRQSGVTEESSGE
jgi:excisionase family DNA binding protein